MTDTVDYDGPERRRDRLALSTALDDVKGLKGAVEKLATAVEGTPSKSDLVLSAQRLRQALLWIAGMLAAFLIIMVFFLTWQHGRLEKHTGSDHEKMVCILQIPIEQRTDTALLACKEGLR